MTFQPRYDEEREVYRDCPWCGGRGCNQCKAEADKAYQAAFPNGPQPIAVFNVNDPGEWDKAREVIGREAIERAFGQDGKGVEEIVENYQRVRQTQ